MWRIIIFAWALTDNFPVEPPLQLVSFLSCLIVSAVLPEATWIVKTNNEMMPNFCLDILNLYLMKQALGRNTICLSHISFNMDILEKRHA